MTFLTLDFFMSGGLSLNSFDHFLIQPIFSGCCFQVFDHFSLKYFQAYAF